MRTPRTDVQNRAFSLVELLTVIAIVALVISIILPVLGSVRTTGKMMATQQVLNDISAAAAKFKADHNGRNPGYFSEREMGSVDNATRGMSGMENAMLDLAGENAIVDSGGAGIVEVGPVASETIFVNPALIGADKGAYYTPSREYYEAQLSSTGQQVGVEGHAASSETDPQLLDIVDAFGNPVLFWSADTYTVSQATSLDQFAQINYAPGSTPAMFYWNSNAAFLQSTNLGRGGRDQTVPPQPGVHASLLGPGAGEEERKLTMSALLGSISAARVPAGQSLDDVLQNPSEASIEAIFPGRGRGAFVVHSAGPDGVYLSSKDKGFSTVAHEGDHIEFGLSFFANENSRLTDEDGNPTSRDLMEEFDDILVSGGG